MAAAALGLWIPVILRHLPSIMRAVHDLYATWCTMRGTSHNNSVVLKAMKLLMKHQNNLDTLLQNPNEKKQVLEGLTILINRINQSGGGGGGGGNGGGGPGNGYGARALPPPPLPSAPSPEYPSKDRRWRVCDVCLSEYNFTDKKPMILFCGHTFCRECLKEVFSQNNKCPTCRQRDTRSFSALPPNVELLRMLEDEEWNKEDEDLKKNGEKSGCISGGCDGGCGDGDGDDAIPLSFEDQIQFAIFLSTQTAQTRGHEFVEAKWKEIECEEDEMLAQALQLSEVYEISQACSTQRREGECVRGKDDDDGDGGNDCALNQQSECAQRKQSNCAMNQESNCAEREENDCPKSQQSECAQREQDKSDLNQSDNEEEQEEEGGEGAAAAAPPPGAAASRYEEEEASLRLALELHFEEIALKDKLNGCAGGGGCGGGGDGCDGTTEPTSDWIEQYHRYLGSCSYHPDGDAKGEDDLDRSKMDERSEEKGGEDEGRNIDAKEEEEKEEEKEEALLICGGRDEEEEKEPMKCYEEEDEKRKNKNNNNNNNNNNCGRGGGGGEESGNQCIESENDCDDGDGDGVASLCCSGEEEWKKKKKCNGEEDDPLEEKGRKEQFSKMMREQEEALIEMALQMSLKDLHNGPKEEEE